MLLWHDELAALALLGIFFACQAVLRAYAALLPSVLATLQAVQSTAALVFLLLALQAMCWAALSLLLR